MIRSRLRYLSPFFTAGLIICILFSAVSAQQLPERLLVGYWHNWGNSPNSLRLTELPDAYDVINVSFAVPSEQMGAEMIFTPDPGIYPIGAEFIDDIQALQTQGKKVLISIGGATAPIHVENADDAALFVSSMLELFDQYGFDGMDIDLEGGSLLLDAGDTDFQNPTSPRIVYFIQAVQDLLADYGDGFILTSAPETAYVQGGHSAYGGIWGAYLPVLHALREDLTFVHVQLYNTGSMFGRDGNIYESSTADFHVAMADMLLAGFAVSGGSYFDPFNAEQVAIGLPASNQAAGSGYTSPVLVHDAVTYIVLGEPYGGSYQLSNIEGYSEFRGLMTWSINWDVDNNLEFANSYRTFLDTLDIDAVQNQLESGFGLPHNAILSSVYPNPFNSQVSITFDLPQSTRFDLIITDITGRILEKTFCSANWSGRQQYHWNADGYPSGIYLYQIAAPGLSTTSGRLLLVK